ncbi:MAG: GNAT family N-acetyltransferase [bacterium]
MLAELGGEGEAIGSGWMACDVPGSWADYAAGLGEDGPVTRHELEELVAFYVSRNRVPKLQLTPYQHPSLLENAVATGFAPFEFETLLAHWLEDLPTPRSLSGYSFRILEPTSPADVDAFVDAQNLGFFDGNMPNGMVNITRRVLGHSRTTAWLVEFDGEPVGSAGIEVFEGSAVLIAGAVVAEHRRKGVQQALMARRLRHAAELGCEYALVQSMPNGPTERNALKLGFVPVTTLVGLSRH